MVVLRALVAALVVLHVLLTRGKFSDGDLLGLVAAAAGLFVASSVVAYLAHLHAPTVRLRNWGVVLVALLDSIALVTIARATVGIDPTASITWCFVLWVPFSLALAVPPLLALAGTFGVGIVAMVVGLAAPGALSPIERSWTAIGVPALLIVVAGLLIVTGVRTVRHSAQQLVDRLAQEQLRTARLRDADELKNTFLAAVSHELRTPLTSILGFSLTILDRPGITEEQRTAMLRTIVEEAEHLEDILANMLDLDRLTRGKATLVSVESNPADLVRGVAGRLHARTGREVELDLEDGPSLLLDAAKVERIVENLISNAVKYTPADAAIQVRLRYERHGVVVRVDDGGPGISPELREAIFEPFRRGNDVGVAGTGIGLSLVDRFSRLHGGRAWVEERPGGGCRFQVYLPAPTSSSSRGDDAEQGASSGVTALADPASD